VSACVIAIGAVSGLGRGRDAYNAGPVGELPPSAIAFDQVLADAGLSRTSCARAKTSHPDVDRATALLRDAYAQLVRQLDEVLPTWRSRRVGLSVGTSSGGMRSAELFFEALDAAVVPDTSVAAAATYFAPFHDTFISLETKKRCQVVAACASSTIAIGLGMRWLERDACDLVIAGGYDAVSTFVAAGFEVLRATSATGPRPFRVQRDGMVLGEGAGLIALVREAAHAKFVISGFGASADAVHITAPDREGLGLLRAGQAALRDAGCDRARIHLLSAHGTSTPYNDSAEAAAIGVLGEPLVHAFKAQIGHTLGAAGVLELLAAADALCTQVAPATAGEGELDPDAAVSLLERAETRDLDAALKWSAAFGGVTAALVVERQPRPDTSRSAQSPRPVHVVDWAIVSDVDRVALAAATGVARHRLARIDDLGQLAIAAVAALVAKTGRERLEGAGVIAGYGMATIDTNRRFYQRLLDKGARRVDPRVFPSTSPNAGAGHCAIIYGLTGPNFATNGGLCGSLEALAAGAELIGCGDADSIVVIAADDDGPAAQACLNAIAPGRAHARGAVAALLSAGANDGPAIDPDLPICHSKGAIGHLALRFALESLCTEGRKA
jgi:3-oxoacyl-[acyl-carrier-protein] synthase II